MSDDGVIDSAQGLMLEPCAHCGCEAGVRGSGRTTIGHGETAFRGRVGCQQVSCGVSVYFTGRDDAEILTAIIDAAAVWNKRI